MTKNAAPKTSDVAAAAGHAIDVRTSEVHPIDANVTADGKPPQVVASLDPNKGTVAPAQKGASSCLSVDSDGSHWGFRNHCGFHEDVTVGIGQRLVEEMKPRWLRIGGYWYPRGGMPIDVFWQTGQPPKGLWLPDPGVQPYRGRG